MIDRVCVWQAILEEYSQCANSEEVIEIQKAYMEGGGLAAYSDEEEEGSDGMRLCDYYQMLI